MTNVLWPLKIIKLSHLSREETDDTDNTDNIDETYDTEDTDDTNDTDETDDTDNADDTCPVHFCFFSASFPLLFHNIFLIFLLLFSHFGTMGLIFFWNVLE